MTPLPGEEGYTASVALEAHGETGWFGGPPGFGMGAAPEPAQLLVVGSPGEPVSGDFEETPRVFLIEVERWFVDAATVKVGTPARFKVRLGASWFLLDGCVTSCGSSVRGEMASLEITGEVEGLGKVVIDAR